MKLEICHPNELIYNGWKFVEEVGDDWQDHLRSPSFEWYRGLLVRIDDQYTGIFNASECVDVGYLSDVMLAIYLHEPHRARTFMNNKSFPEAWRTSNDPENMVTTLQNFLRSSDRLAWALLACVDDQSTNDIGLFNNVIQDVKLRLSDKHHSLRTLADSLSNYDGGILNNNTANALWSLVKITDDIRRASDVIYYLNKDNLIDQRLANILRREMPFHEIAEELVR